MKIVRYFCLALTFALLGVAPHAHVATRIVSLVPSFTEDLFALGVGDRIVAVTTADNYPAAVKKLPPVASFSSVNAERIVALHPDLVVGIPAQARLLGSLRAAGVHVVLLPDDRFADISADITILGNFTGRVLQAQKLNARLAARTRALQVATRLKSKPRVLVVVNVQPIIAASQGSYISKLVELAGGTNALTVKAPAYPNVSAESILTMQPDAIITDPQTNLSGVLNKDPWRRLQAVARHHVFVVNPADILERPGPRYIDGLSWLIARFKRLQE